jgi:tRNA pseudouridine55 synthase
MAFDGVLVIDKPSGPTSSDVVLRVKRLLGLHRIGHTGTLDPLATGVLPLCLGRATRLSAYLTEMDKSYRAQVRLGVRTETGDAEGRVLSERPVPPLSEAVLEEALASLRGAQAQTPPMYSAVKVGGRKLYELARQGKEIERVPRAIEIHELVLETLSSPDLTLRISCSKGTFVRVLAEELGERLGCGAHLTGLRRLRSGAFDLAGAVRLQDLVEDEPEARTGRVARALVSMADAVGQMERVVLELQEAAALLASGRLPSRELRAAAGLVAVVNPDGDLIALAESDGVASMKLRRVFPRSTP